MEILLTAWALRSYIDLKAAKVFSEEEFWNEIRPKVLLLKQYPTSTEFQNSKFWSVATDRSGNIIKNGFKMKWHQIGNGKIQLRLHVAVIDQECFLCNAYVKHNEKIDFRMAAKLVDHIALIKSSNATILGRL